MGPKKFDEGKQQEAIQDLRALSNQGNIHATDLLGWIYTIQQNRTEAVKWTIAAAEGGGNYNAQTRLGWMYDTGIFLQQNHEEAFKWYVKAAQKGHPSAQVALGEIYKDGKGILRDEVKAIYWLLKVVEQDNIIFTDKIKKSQKLLAALDK